MDDEWTSLEVESRLIDVGDGRVIWSRTQSTAAQDQLALQAGIARKCPPA